MIAVAQYTIVDLNDPIQQGEEPSSPVDGMLWLDTSVEPNVLKRYDGATGQWVIVNDTSDLGQRITTVESSLTDENGKIIMAAQRITKTESAITGLDQRVESAELKLTPDGIMAVVSSSDKYKADLAGAALTSDEFETFVMDSDSISALSQTANKIEWVVASESTASNLVLTENMINVMSEKIDLSANESITLVVQEKVAENQQIDVANVAPTESLKTGDLWLDTSVIPNLLKKWNGRAWQVVNDTAGLEYLLSSQIDVQKGRIDLVVTNQDSSSSVALTPGAMSFISENITIKAEKINAIANEIDISANNSITLIAGKADDAKTTAQEAVDTAKDAQTIADDAGNNANDALNIANAAMTKDDFKRVVRIDDDGLHVGDNTTACEVLIDSASVNIVIGGTKFSTFSDKFIRFDNMQIRKASHDLVISVYKQ